MSVVQEHPAEVPVAGAPSQQAASAALTGNTLLDLYHFIISLVVLVGGGFMAYNGKADGLAPAAIGAVLVFWFQRSTLSKTLGSLTGTL